MQWADRLEQEMANLRAAHRWLMHRANPDGALRLSAALLIYARFYTGVGELHSWAEEAAQRFGSSGHPALAAAWGTAATGAWQRGDPGQAERLTERSLVAASDRSNLLHLAVQIAGVVQLTLGRFDRAAELLRRSAERSQVVSDDLSLVYTHAPRLPTRLLVGVAGLSALSLEARHGDPRTALARYPELIEHWERSGAWNGMW